MDRSLSSSPAGPCRRLAALTILLPLLGACASAPAPAGKRTASGDRTAAVLAINDVYRIEGVDGGAVAGLARLRTLRMELEKSDPELLLVHAGDLLYPSLPSRIFDGEQMIDVLNALDGDPAASDPRMFITFGNHEFDKKRCKDSRLAQRVRQSQFRWLAGNVDFSQGQPCSVAPAENVERTFLVTSGGIRIGLFGLTIPTKDVEYAKFDDRYKDVAELLTADLRRQGAEVVIGVTHLNAADDQALLAALGDAGPDLILGGHDHSAQATEVLPGRWVLKADADARTATEVHLVLPAGGKLRVEHRLRKLDTSVAEDCDVARRAEGWLGLHDGIFCARDAEKEKTPLDIHCLEKPLGRTREPLEGEETEIRRVETSLGNWIADLMVQGYAACGAQAAFINSGTMRLNQNLPAGTQILRRHLEELFGFPVELRVLRLKGSTLREVATHAITGWPGSGRWLQVSGLAFVHDGDRSATSLTLVGPDGSRRPVRDDEELVVVTSEFLADPDDPGDQDLYTMLDVRQQADTACEAKVGRLDLKKLARAAFEAAGEEGIAPKVEGRICEAPAGAGCLAASDTPR